LDRRFNFLRLASRLIRINRIRDGLAWSSAAQLTVWYI
jgi:hypothetical protein